jgi:hypothetical protein
MKRFLLSLLVPSVALAAIPPAHAEVPPPVDVHVAEAPAPRRWVSIEWNPLSLIVGKASANVVLVPLSHHALVLSPFYVSTTTNPIQVYDDQGTATQLPQQTFSGFGGEIGYRYYAGHGGPRGFFAGPSLIVASMTATAQNGDKTSYLDYGLALDIGYELLVGDAVAVSLGLGAQYTTTNKSIPAQQFPADAYANSRVFPRALFSIGWAP